MRCEEIMCTDVAAVGPDETLINAAQLMRERSIGFLPVCGDAGRVVGAVTDRDLVVRGLAGASDGVRRIADVMTREVVACAASDDLDRAEALMAERQKSRLMVCDEDGRLQGVISLSDLAQRRDVGKAAATLRQVTWRDQDTPGGVRSGEVSQVMKRDVVCTRPGSSIASAAKLMRDRNVGFLPVCDRDGRVVGTITDRDIAICALAEGRGPGTPVREVMCDGVVTCREDDDLERAQELMSHHQKSRLLVCDPGGRLVGVVSLSALAKRQPADQAGETLQKVSRREAG